MSSSKATAFLETFFYAREQVRGVHLSSRDIVFLLDCFVSNRRYFFESVASTVQDDALCRHFFNTSAPKMFVVYVDHASRSSTWTILFVDSYTQSLSLSCGSTTFASFCVELRSSRETFVSSCRSWPSSFRGDFMTKLIFCCWFPDGCSEFVFSFGLIMHYFI